MFKLNFFVGCLILINSKSVSPNVNPCLRELNLDTVANTVYLLLIYTRLVVPQCNSALCEVCIPIPSCNTGLNMSSLMSQRSTEALYTLRRLDPQCFNTMQSPCISFLLSCVDKDFKIYSYSCNQ